MVQGLIWGFWKNQMAKLSYYDLLVIWSLLKFVFSPQDFSQLPFMLKVFTWDLLGFESLPS
jgi:hypothetical protein